MQRYAKKNIGQSYLSRALERAGVKNKCKITEVFAKEAAKKERLELRTKRKQSDTSTELRQGDTYKSGYHLIQIVILLKSRP